MTELFNLPVTRCIVCSMQLHDGDDFPGGDLSKDYCRFCGTSEALHSYPTLVEDMTKYIVITQGLENPLAKLLARRAVDNSEAVRNGRLEVTISSII